MGSAEGFIQTLETHTTAVVDAEVWGEYVTAARQFQHQNRDYENSRLLVKHGEDVFTGKPEA